MDEAANLQKNTNKKSPSEGGDFSISEIFRIIS